MKNNSIAVVARGAFLAAFFAVSCQSSGTDAPPSGASPAPAVGQDSAGTAASDAAWCAAIADNPARAAGLFHRYEFMDSPMTPPPQGFVPFYIAHYGRHGSRYQISDKSFAVVKALEEGEKAGILTDTGKRILDALRPIVAEHDGMWGQLSLLGAEEHRLLAKRMYARFPEVFAAPGRVRCQSSTVQRCLSSMANFACTLKGEVPELDFSFATGDRYMRKILHPYLPSEERKEWLGRFDRRIVRDLVDPSRIVALCFGDGPKAAEVAGDPHGFAFDLFSAANSFESLVEELDGATIDWVFTQDELAALAKARSCIHYAHMGNCAEYGSCAALSAADLARDIAARADEAIADGTIRADLRFGHDSGIMPLVGYIGLVPAGGCLAAADSWKEIPTWRYLCMASNLQLVFYRREGSEPIVKVLYNERETPVSGLDPAAPGSYYRWSDLKARLEKSVVASAANP